MTKELVTVEVELNENYMPIAVVLKKGRRELRVEYGLTGAGSVRSYRFLGSRRGYADLLRVFQVVDARLAVRMEEGRELMTFGGVAQPFYAKSFVRNGSFEAGFLNWYSKGATIDTAQKQDGLQSVKFTGLGQQVRQDLLYDLPIKLLDDYSFYLRVTNLADGLTLRTYYDETDYVTEAFTCGVINTWEKKYPTTLKEEKNISKMLFLCFPLTGSAVWLDTINISL